MAFNLYAATAARSTFHAKVAAAVPSYTFNGDPWSMDCISTSHLLKDAGPSVNAVRRKAVLVIPSLPSARNFSSKDE